MNFPQKYHTFTSFSCNFAAKLTLSTLQKLDLLLK